MDRSRSTSWSFHREIHMAIEERPDAETGTPTRGGTVLFIDDEPDILALIRLFMEELLPRIEVHTAASGPEAIEQLHAGSVDVVVSDFRMPGMDGIELLAATREIQPDAERVLFTAYADPDLVERAGREAGVELVCSKGDVSLPELLQKVATLLPHDARPTPTP